MKRFVTLAAVSLALTFGAALHAQDAAPAAKPARAAKPPAKPKLYTQMEKELDLTEAQKAQLLERIQARDAEVAEWNTKHLDRQKELGKKLQEARTAKNTQEAATVGKELKVLSTDRQAIEARHQSNIIGVLTPEQKQKWTAHNLEAATMRKYRELSLTDAQKADIQTRVDKAAAELAALEDPQGKSGDEITKKLNAGIVGEVLTQDQRDILDRPMKDKEAAKAAAKANKEAQKAAQKK